uniref:Transmembrane protein n=1 Tax=Tanacetum cinerariifolium TaxID=118510 RepID=A0A6L2J9N0_TANCI|nr:hypothetical protein [Tanacetum cinerariifolium]
MSGIHPRHHTILVSPPYTYLHHHLTHTMPPPEPLTPHFYNTFCIILTIVVGWSVLYGVVVMAKIMVVSYEAMVVEEIEVLKMENVKGLESKAMRECCFVVERDAWLRGFSFFLQMGLTLILATLDGLNVGLLGDVIGEDDYDNDV